MEEVLDRLYHLEDAFAIISRLQKALADSESACKGLEEQLRLCSIPQKILPPSLTPKKFSTVASTGLSKKLKQDKKETPFLLPCLQSQSCRTTWKKYRKIFHQVRLDNYRILDMHFHVREVLSVLVHEYFVLVLTSTLKSKLDTEPLFDFDPYKVKNVHDSALLASLTPSALANKAKEVQNRRVLKAIAFIRLSVRAFFAHSMLEQSYIEQTQFKAILADELGDRPPQTKKPVTVISKKVVKAHARINMYHPMLFVYPLSARNLAATLPSPTSALPMEEAMGE